MLRLATSEHVRDGYADIMHRWTWPDVAKMLDTIDFLEELQAEADRPRK